MTPTEFLDIGCQAVAALEYKEGRKGCSRAWRQLIAWICWNSIRAQAVQHLVLGRLADLAWEMGEDKPDTALQLWDKQRLAPKGTSLFPCQSKQR